MKPILKNFIDISTSSRGRKNEKDAETEFDIMSPLNLNKIKFDEKSN